MADNLNDAPPNLEESQRDQMKNEIKKEGQKILEKYFEGREYNKEKVQLWKDYSLEDISTFLVEKYINYGFVISIIIIKIGSMSDNSNYVLRNNTDSNILISIETKTMYCLMRIFFYKKYSSKINLNKAIEDNIFIYMNNILTNKLEGVEYSYEISDKESKNIVNELNDYLLNKKEERRPCSCNQCSILKKPIDFVFNYKVINLDYIPLMVSYSNDSLYSQLVLIILNN